ncbi:MAG: alpha/beta fold hydrolase [Sandaracinaceae bacterium]|nr:alpha/beta fold hydrolase [Sandaracinaceae bacterium]
MPEAFSNGITLHYDEHGAKDAPPILLIMGLSLQMIAWPEALCADLAARGFRVIRFDNRDVGLSTKLFGAPSPTATDFAGLFLLGRRLPAARVAYRLTDLADDALGLLDALGLESAHVVGLSMGGMVAQEMLLRAPGRVRSLVSMHSSTLEPGLPMPTADARKVLFQSPPRSREEAIERGVEVFRVIGSPSHFDAARTRARTEHAHDRSSYRLGVPRQLAAILSSEPRHDRLRRTEVPAAVVHGRLDPLLPVAHGESTARALRGASLHVLDDLGHDLPEAHLPRFAEIIADTAHRGERGQPPGNSIQRHR